MRHDLTVEGTAFRLRPVRADDAAAIVALRSDPELSRFVHAVSPDVTAQEAWLERYFGRDGDYYFIVESIPEGRFEGTIAVYDVADRQGEWGRWVLRGGSMAASESALLIYSLAFDTLGLDEVYCRTVALNEAVLSFHDRCGLRRAGVQEGAFHIGSGMVDAVEHRLGAQEWPTVRSTLQAQAGRVAQLLRRRAAAPPGGVA